MEISRIVPVLDAADVDAESSFWGGLLGGTVTAEDGWKTISVNGEPRLDVQLAPDHVPPQFQEVFAMKPGTWTKPIRTSSGWHIIGLIGIAPKRQLSFDEVKAAATQGAEEKKKRAMRDDWLVKLRTAAKIDIDDKAVRQFVEANPIEGVQSAPAMQHSLEPAAH